MDALIAVLCSIPDSDYQKLSPAFSSTLFFFHMPEGSAMGSAKTISFRVNFIYLSARLEEESELKVKGVIAHELAHILLEHTRSTKLGEVIKREAREKAKS
jgi:Zn-dependent protease with chaperone function